MFKNPPALILVAAMMVCGTACRKNPEPDVAPVEVVVEEPKEPWFDAQVLEVIDRPRPPQPVPARLVEPVLWRSNLSDEMVPTKTAKVEVTGRVLGHDGKPTAGSRVVLTSFGRQISTGRAGADGRFTFGVQELPAVPRNVPGVRPLVLYRVYAHAESGAIVASNERGFVDGPRPDWDKNTHAIYQGEPIHVELKHPEAASLSGRVVGPDGVPIGNAKVRLVSVVPRAGNPFSNDGWVDDGLERVTDPDGLFKFGNMPAESRVTVEIAANGFACVHAAALTAQPAKTSNKPDVSDLWHPGRGGSWTIQLAEPIPRQIQVVDQKAGRPMAGFNVVVELTNPRFVPGGDGLMKEINRVIPVVPKAWARTDANGYAVVWLPPGDYDILASPDGNPGFHAAGLHAWPVDSNTTERPTQIKASPYIVTVEFVEAGTGKPVERAVVQLVFTYATPDGKPVSPFLPRTFFWGPTTTDGQYKGHNPFFIGQPHLDNPGLGYTSGELRSALARCDFKVVSPEGWEPVEVPTADFATLLQTKPTFRFVLRRPRQ